MIKEKYLPLGTVVMLKGGKKRIMIIGFAGLSAETGDKMFDYIGCLYPEGIISSDKNLLFDHDQIETIYHEGYSDEENINYQNKLKDLISKNLNLDSQNNIVNNNSNYIDIPILMDNKDSEDNSSIETFNV